MATAVTTVLEAAPGADAAIAAWRALANQLIEQQKALLAPDQASPAYRDYVAGESCRVLSKLNSSAVEGLLGDVAQTASEPVAAALRRVTAGRPHADRQYRALGALPLVDRQDRHGGAVLLLCGRRDRGPAAARTATNHHPR